MYKCLLRYYKDTAPVGCIIGTCIGVFSGFAGTLTSLSHTNNNNLAFHTFHCIAGYTSLGLLCGALYPISIPLFAIRIIMNKKE
jgi:hypothetical protein